MAEKYLNNTGLETVWNKIKSIFGMPEPLYEEVEWVESTGKQYVYLDWKPPIETWGFEADFIIKNKFNTTQAAWNSSTNTDNSGMLFGVRSSNGVNDVELGTYGSTGYFRAGGGTIPCGIKTDKTRQTIKLIGTTLTKPDGTTTTIQRSTENTSKPYHNMTIFAYYDGLRRSSYGGLNYPSTSRIYSLKFYEGETVKVHLVGAIRKSDNTTGLYDKISNHFYPAPAMNHGEVVGNLGQRNTILNTAQQGITYAMADNREAGRLWRINLSNIKALEDGQQISVMPLYSVPSSIQTTELKGWDDTGSSSYVYLKATLADGTETDWIPCYYQQTTRLTNHYGSNQAILFTYRENVIIAANATTAGYMIVRGFFGDVNYNTDRLYDCFSDSVVAGKNGAKRYTLCMQDDEGNWTSIVNQANNAGATGKTCYTSGLKLGKILYHATGSDYGAGANSGAMYQTYLVDARYSTNGITSSASTTTLQLRKPFYLVGTLGNDGLFYLDELQWWTQIEPISEDGKVYILVGWSYTSNYYIYLAANNPAYVYKNGKFRPLMDIYTIEADVPSDAKFTDTTYSAGTGLSLSGTTINHSNSVTAGTIGTSSDSTGARTISIPYATYDAQGHITNKGTHTHTITSFPEAYLSWGDKHFSGSYGVIDAAMIPELGANRFAFLKAGGLEIEYSTDNGATWLDYGATDSQKVGLFGNSQQFFLGKASTKEDNTANNQLRVTITTDLAFIYTVLNKIAIYMSTSGNTVFVKIEKATKGDPTNYSTHLDWTGISGWSGWNILNINNLTTYGNTDSQYQKIRFTFKQTAINANYASANISKIMGFGGMGWSTPSWMAGNGHLYKYDNDQNATFPAKITANNGFVGNLTGNVTGTATNVTGTVAVANGGTGKTSGKDAANYFMNALDTGSSTPADADYYISQYVNGGTTTTTYHRRPMSALWEYIKSKISSILGLTATTYSGSAAKVNNHTVNSDVPSNAKFTDTITTATTSGSGNAVTAITATNGALTVTKGTTFLTSHQDISGKADKSATVSTVSYDSTNKKITKTINGTTSDVVTAATLKTAMGLDNVEANQNAFSNVKIGSTTVSADSKTDTLELAAGSNITLTPDATNDKITIAATDTTYESKAAAEDGTALSLVTTGEKYLWNNAASGTGSASWNNISGKPTETEESTTGISIGNHATGTVIGVQSSTTSVIGVQSGTTTASKVTLGTALSIPNVTGASDVTVPKAATSATTVPIKNTTATSIPNVTDVGSASNWVFENVTVPIKASSATTVPIAASSATTVPIKDASATTIPNVTDAGSGSASLTFTMDSTDTKKLIISFSHTHTPPTIGTPISVTGVQSTTTSVTGVNGSTSVTGVQSSTTTASHVKSGGNGTAPTLGTAISIYGVQSSTTSVTGVSGSTTASKVTLGTAIDVPNVTNVNDVTVPIKATSATTVPIKNTSASTFVTGATHTITDNGHTHSIN